MKEILVRKMHINLHLFLCEFNLRLLFHQKRRIVVTTLVRTAVFVENQGITFSVIVKTDLPAKFAK